MAREVRGPETGGTNPRAANQGDTTEALVALGVLFLLSPAALVTGPLAVWAFLAHKRRHWWEFAAVGVLVTFAVGAVLQITTGNLVAFHYGGFIDALRGTGSWIDAVAGTLPIGVPAGITAGALYVGYAQRQTGAAEWHPVEQRRRDVNQHKADTRMAAVLADTDAEMRATAPPLGVWRGGDLGTWAQGPFAVPPPGKFPAMGLLGESGSGKTVTAERLVSLWARSGRKVIFADFKGTDPELAARVIAAYKTERPDACCALWPAQPLDIWRGSPVEIANRLLQVQDFTEPFYKGVAEAAVRLVMLAPDIDGTGPVTDSGAFMRRLDGEFLRRAYEGTPEVREVAKVTRKPEHLDGVALRYSGFFSALAGRLDHGFSFEDCDLAILSVPTLAQRSDAMAVARMVLTDFGAYCVSRKPRIGEDVTFIVDEFSAVTEAAPMVIDLAERVRDVGGQVVVSAQSYEGLGRDDSERRRMIASLAPGGLVVHRLADPDEVLKAAGTVRAVEQSWQLDDHGSSGMGSAKMAHKMRVDPDAVRQAETGEAWIVTHGRAAHVQIKMANVSAEELDHARRLVNLARLQANEDFAAGRRAQVRPWWEVPVLDRPRAELEAGGLGELMAGPDGPPGLPPAPGPVGPDPRLVLAIIAYVRAGQVAQARRIAADAKGIDDPDTYVAELVAERRAELDEARRRRRRQRPR